MRDHAEIGNAVWWPAEPWAWTVDAIIGTQDGRRFLAISRGDTEADSVTRVVPEADVQSNAFTLR